jgi:hypothetical protein
LFDRRDKAGNSISVNAFFVDTTDKCLDKGANSFLCSLLENLDIVDTDGDFSGRKILKQEKQMLRDERRRERQKE